MTQICIFGAGGVGGYLAARLVHAGRDVSIVARGEHLQAIRESGLTLVSGEERITGRLPASETLADLARPDVIIVSVKTTALGSAAEAIGPYLGPDTVVIFAVNGVFWFYGAGRSEVRTERLDPQGVLHREIGVKRAFGMVVRSQNEVVAPGRVLNNGGGQYLLGSALPGSDRLAAIAKILNVSGTSVAATSDLGRDMWRKLIRNIAVALVCVPLQSTAGEAFSDPAVRPVALGVMREASAVAAAHGFRDVLDLEADADVVSRMTVVKPSIVQDLERGRPMEIDSQVLAVQDFARQTAVATPIIDALSPLVVLRAQLAGAYPICSDKRAHP
jgi:2-dehydropantoate 2-reductase